MWTMILHMSVAVLIYMLVTGLSWSFWQRRKHTLAMKLAIGVVFGLCSVASTHFGIDYTLFKLNVRDIGPLAAGLFFDPLSGILAGLIGGIERYIAAEVWDIGYYTRVACSLSTCLAGFLPVAIRRWVYREDRLPLDHVFSLGCVMEVFHMYAVFFTHHNDMETATAIVKLCAVPMILFTGVGLVGCAIVVRLLSHEKVFSFSPKSRASQPLSSRFQIQLLSATLVAFAINLGITWSYETIRANDEARDNLASNLMYIELSYDDDDADSNAFFEALTNRSMQNLQTELIIILDNDGRIVFDSFEAFNSRLENPVLPSVSLTPEQTALVFNTPYTETFPLQLMPTEEGVLDLLCMSRRISEKYTAIACTYAYNMYDSRTRAMYENTFSDILIFTILYMLVYSLVNALVVRNLKKVNTSLQRITGGNLDEKVRVEESLEFTELSSDINLTVDALKGYIEQARQRMKDDLKLAATIQAAALPRVFDLHRSAGKGEIYALMNPAKEVGGDFYDFFFIDDRSLVLVIADVSGKGVPASLFMMQAKIAIKNAARSNLTPAQMLEKVNAELLEGNEADMFVTVWIGILDLVTGLMRCANAGHEYPVLMRAGESYELYRDPHSMALAVIPDLTFKDYELRLNPGDRLFVYTDGVPEAINEAEQEYGTDRLVEKLNTVKTLPQQNTLNAILQDLNEFKGKADQFDDITMIGFTYLGPKTDK